MQTGIPSNTGHLTSILPWACEGGAARIRPVPVLRFSRTQLAPRRYVCVETTPPAALRALFFFWHDDGCWRVFLPAVDRLPMGVRGDSCLLPRRDDRDVARPTIGESDDSRQRTVVILFPVPIETAVSLERPSGTRRQNTFRYSGLACGKH